MWKDNEEVPEAIFSAFNTAVTAWHITDWLWQSSDNTRGVLSKRFGFPYNEETASGVHTGLERFQEAIASSCRELYVCREIANGSKHMRTKKLDPDIRATATWKKTIEGAGFARPGDLVLALEVSDGGKQQDGVWLFIGAFGYWEQLFRTEKLISRAARLPEKIIRSS